MENKFEMSDNENLYMGVDVGSHSVRCAVVTEKGHIKSLAVEPIKTWTPANEFYQQSSEDIWQSTSKAIKLALVGINGNNIQSIGFDATCSLVVLDKKLKPLSVSLKGEQEQNIIVWMDHRAKIEAEEINSLKLDCLKFVGGTISPEMQPPKIMWLKKHLGLKLKDIGCLFDLPDFLTWKATGNFSRSLCSVVCKWLFQANKENQYWDSSIWKQLDLEELIENNFAIIGDNVLIPGVACGYGLSLKAALELGLKPSLPVSSSMIDAHAGGIGTLGCFVEGISRNITTRLAIISGTSACHMKLNENPIFVPGVWGPYYSAMIPGLYLNEAGQSAAGSLIDHIINSHPASQKLQRKNKHIQEELNDILIEISAKEKVPLSQLTSELHIWPDFHGNRSPLADPTLTGMIMGLTLSTEIDNLAKIYLSTIQALAYGTLHIIKSMESCGHSIESLVLCGGLAKNQLFVKTHADVTGLPVLLPDEPEPVLLGAAILGAAASGNFKNLEDAMLKMGGKGTLIKPDTTNQRYHSQKYRVFLSMVDLQKSAQKEMLQK